MAFADLYPFDDFLSVSHLAWWRGSDVSMAISRMQQDAASNGTSAYISDELRRSQTEASAADAADQKLIDAHKDRFETALRAHLDALRADGRLGVAAGLRGRDVVQARAWNAFVAGRPDDWETTRTLSSIARVFVFHFVRMDDGRHARKREEGAVPGAHQAPTAEQAKTAWTAICASMDAGDSGETWDGWPIECNDQKSGDRCVLRFSGWQPVLLRWNASHELESAKDLGPIPLAAAGFDVPTGDLLITDYLRVEGIREAIDFGDREHGRRLDISSAEGQSNRTAAHAETHRMGFCQTDNTYVTAWRNGTTGAIAVLPHWDGTADGDHNPSASGWEKLGDVSCDVWRITALDVSVAGDLSLAGGGPGRSAVDRYLALRNTPAPSTENWSDHAVRQAHHDHCYANNVLRMKVPAGRWTIHCGDRFASRLPRHRFGLPKGMRPWCVLTPPKAA